MELKDMDYEIMEVYDENEDLEINNHEIIKQYQDMHLLIDKLKRKNDGQTADIDRLT